MKWVINAGTGELEPINSAKLNLGQRFDLGGLAGRVGLKPGGLVEPGVEYYGSAKVKTESLGDGIFELTSDVTGKKTYYGKVQRKKETLKSPHGSLADAKKWVVEKKKIPQAKSIIELQIEKGTLLEQSKYKKALADALDELAKMEEKGYGAIDEIVKKYQNMFSRVGETTVQGKIIKKRITTESTAITSAIRSYAAENNIRDVQIKKMEKALDDYRTKKTPERGYVPKLMKKYGILETTFNSWLIELDARRKIPKKYKNESEKIKAVRAKRAAALKKYSSGAFEKWTKGTMEIHGGHTGQIYSEYVTPETKKYTPAKINQETLKKFDAILQGIADKRDKAFKAKNWAEVERLNVKGMNVAAATEGYKTFTVKNPDGSTWVSGKTTKGTIDLMDLTKKGITAKEMESYYMGKNPEIVKAQKLLDKKLISPAEFETIRAKEEAKLFAEGKNKALLEFQKQEAIKSAKLNKSEIKALDKRLRANLEKFLSAEDTTKLSKTIQSIMSKKNSGLNIVDIARWGSAELSALDDIAGKIPSKALGAFGKLLKFAGIVAIPIDALPFTAAHSKGLTPDVGAMNLAEIYSNLPGMIWEAGEWVASKVQGKEHEWKPFYEFEFGRDYQTKKLKETPLPVLEKRVKNWATDMAPAEEFDKVSSYLDRRGIPGITDENVQLQQYEEELLNQMRKEKALADKEKKASGGLSGVDQYILNRYK